MLIITKLSLIDVMAFLCLAAVGALAWAAESGVLGDHKKAAGISMLGLVCVFIAVLATSKAEDSLLFGNLPGAGEEEKGEGTAKERGQVKFGKKKKNEKVIADKGEDDGGIPEAEVREGGGSGKAPGDGAGETAGADKAGDGKDGKKGEDAVAGANCADEAASQPKAKKGEDLARPGVRGGAGLQDCPHCPRLALIPAGCTEIGAPLKQAGFRQEEAPVTRIKVSSPFYLGRYEVTRGEFRAFVEATGYRPSQGCNGADGWIADRNWSKPGFTQDNNHPVVCVSWADAKAYVDWLSETTRQSYRLPSEGEWEHAVRAGSKSAYGFADKLDSGDANYGRRLGGTAPVGQFTANAYGLLDTAGNVWEMVQDCWEPGHLGLPLDGGARVSSVCEERIMRGGGWSDGARNLRAAARMPRKEGAAGWALGFRVLREPGGPARASVPAMPAAPAGEAKRVDAIGGPVQPDRATPAAAPSVAVGAAAAAGAAAIAAPMVVGGARAPSAKASETAPAKGQRKASDGQGGKRRERDR